MKTKQASRKIHTHVKLSKLERDRLKRDRKFKIDINTVFANARFTQISTRGKNIIIDGREGEIDNIFVYENVIVFVEDTTSSNDGIKSHLLKTADYFKHILNNKANTLRELDVAFPKFKQIRYPDQYTDDDYRWVFVYASLNSVDRKYETRHPDIIFYQYAHLQYFLSLSKTIGASMRFELFNFLCLRLIDVGIQKNGQDKREYTAVVLPDSPSGFPPGHKIVSFLIEPSMLLEQSYVLRSDGWQDTECLYQRLLIKNKIIKMREYLSSEKRVFVNNIIATLPEDTRFLDINTKNQIDPAKLTASQMITVELRRQFASIGLVDGQHRVFAYHEGLDKAESVIKILRDKQHLLVTAIMYPESTDALTRTRFEAKLFLEINDKQTRTKGDLRQTIQTVVDPFMDIAIAKRVISNLARSGPLCGHLEEYFYDHGKIKTTSIVSYGLKHIVGIQAKDSLFQIWNCNEKDKLQSRENKHLLDNYVTFCTNEVSHFIAGFRQNISTDLWTPDLKISRVLTTTTINGLVFCLRRLIQEKKIGNEAYYKSNFGKLDIDFHPEKFQYRSSHWRELGKNIFEKCFT